MGNRRKCQTYTASPAEPAITVTVHLIVCEGRSVSIKCTVTVIGCQAVHASVERVDPGGPTEVDRADTDVADPSALIWPVA
jgi:hypothetical protein